MAGGSNLIVQVRYRYPIVVMIGDRRSNDEQVGGTSYAIGDCLFVNPTVDFEKNIRSEYFSRVNQFVESRRLKPVSYTHLTLPTKRIV